MFNNVEFLIRGIIDNVGCFIIFFHYLFSLSRQNCKTVSLRPSRTVKLYFSVPVDLYIVFSDPKNPGQKCCKKSGQKSGQNFGQKSGGTL